MVALRIPGFCLTLVIIFLLQTCKDTGAHEIDSVIGIDIVSIAENPGYKSGYVLRYTLRNKTGKDIFMIIPEVVIWKVDTFKQLQVYDYLAKYHHSSPDVDFKVLDSTDLNQRGRNQNLALQMMGIYKKTKEKNWSIEDANDLVNASVFIFMKKGEEFQYAQGITGIQEDKGSYKILLQSRTFRPRHFEIPDTYDSYQYIQPKIKSDTFNLTIR